jgi:hypothetical protein
LHLLSSFLGGWRDTFRCLAYLVYRLARSVLQPLGDLSDLPTYLSDFFGRPFDHLPDLAGYFPDLLGRSSSYLSDLLSSSLGHFSELAGRSSGHFSNLSGCSLGHLSNLLGRPFGYLPDLAGSSSGYLPNLLSDVTQGAPQAAQTLLGFLTFWHPFSFITARIYAVQLLRLSIYCYTRSSQSISTRR